MRTLNLQFSFVSFTKNLEKIDDTYLLGIGMESKVILLTILFVKVVHIVSFFNNTLICFKIKTELFWVSLKIFINIKKYIVQKSKVLFYLNSHEEAGKSH